MEQFSKGRMALRMPTERSNDGHRGSTKEIDTLNVTRSRLTTRARIAAIAFAALALALPAAAPVHAAGLRNCVDVPVGQSGRVACWEYVWANSVQVRMTFANHGFTGATPGERVGSFYVVAQQAGTPQGAPPNTFAHDHTVAAVPAGNHGEYRVHLRGFIAVCSELGMATGACVPTMTAIEGYGTLPLPKTANGHALTSVGPIESAAAAGIIVLFDTGAVLVATISGK